MLLMFLPSVSQIHLVKKLLIKTQIYGATSCLYANKGVFVNAVVTGGGSSELCGAYKQARWYFQCS